MNHTPVLRNPRLFHQKKTIYNPAYYAQQAAPQATARLYSPYTYASAPPSSYIPPTQSFYSIQTPASYNNQYNQLFPYYPVSPGHTNYSAVPFSSKSMPNTSYSGAANTYSSTASSNGLAIILIATLILAALDLLIVRPIKAINSGQQK